MPASVDVRHGRDQTATVAFVTAHALAVELALFHHDTLLCRARIQIEKQQKSEEFDTETWAMTDGGSCRGHLAIQHRFAIPAASLHLWLIRYRAPESAGEVVLDVALAMGVHDSDDWESIALGEEYTFAFQCRQAKQGT